MNCDGEFERPGHELDDDEYPEPDDESEDAKSETVPCPECGADVYEDAVQCPHCGAYIESTPSKEGAWWIIVGVIVAILAILTLALAAPW